MKKIELTQMYSLPIDRCKTCGECCKQMPGAYLPEDFDSLEPETLAQLMFEKKLAVDWWEGDPRPKKSELSSAYFLRPRTINHRREYTPKDSSWGGVCSNLTDKGCSLPREQMPSGCKMFKADKERCHYPKDAKGTKQNACIAWIPYTEVVEKAVFLAEKMMEKTTDTQSV